MNEVKYLFELEDTYGTEFTYPSRTDISVEYQDAVINSFDTNLDFELFEENFIWAEEVVMNQIVLQKNKKEKPKSLVDYT